ncbi:hypothetical protein GGI25_005080 [Coemansia spiralis]|uniref:Uncharacterized protein n=2 Tax=Coemansia TaxID=4863 RepID=A0A9W8G4W0_9FUNG|nr:hypothetical protein EDC05_002323 [Coemansia umbellata]KAJ2618379.1 hypothetical protein GGI26_006577 [Coemansia sp. RSA 1358]KAJ2672525.1 hypothetical protein GGI25_005080 [Coemansia spiralis]
MNAIKRITAVPQARFGRVAATSRLATVPLLASSRPYTKVETTTRVETAEIEESKHLSPIEFHNYLKSRDRESREFLAEESETVAADSFIADRSFEQHDVQPRKELNEQFRKQIHDLLQPSYGSS